MPNNLPPSQSVTYGKHQKKNFGYNLIYQVVILLAPLITAPYISRILGASGIGQYSFCLSIVTYFLFVINTINVYGRREVGILNENKKQERSNLFFEISFLKLIVGAFLIFLFSLTVFYAFSNNYKTILYILILNLVASLLDPSWFYQGIEKIDVISLVNIISKIIQVTLIFTFVKSNTDIFIYVLILSLVTLFSDVATYPWLKKNLIKPNSINIKRHVKGAFLMLIPYMAVELYVVLDKTLIGVITGSDLENGYYEQAQKIYNILYSVITVLSVVMAPSNSQAYFAQDNKFLNQNVQKAFNFVFLFSFPICAGLFFVIDGFVSLYFGDGYEEVGPIMKALGFLLIFRGIDDVFANQLLIPIKKENCYTVATLISAAVNVCLDCFLIPKYQALGAAIASVIAEIASTLTMAIILRKLIFYKPIFVSSIKKIISSLVMMAVLFGLSYIIKCKYNWIAFVFIGIAVYFLCLVVLKDSFTLTYLKKIKNRIFKKAK